MAPHHPQLNRVKLIPNPNYKRSGTKSYVFLMKKYRFSPTMEGPYTSGNVAHHQGKFGPQNAIGGKTAMRHVLQKKKQHPAGTSKATGTSGNETGEVPAEDSQNDSQYLCEVSIGTPAKTFTLDFDTGSADLWLWSTELPATTTQGTSHTIFDPSASSTFENTSGSTWQISYGDGSSASGTVGTDVVNLGGIIIKNQSIELANTLSTQFQQDTSDGLLGLAFGSINTVQPHAVQTPVENMISQSDIPKTSELFTANLGSVKDANDPDKGASFYTFGYIDQAALGGQTPYYTPVNNSQGFWMFDSTSAVVAGKTIQRSGNTAIADTGTTLCLIDDSTCQAIYKAIPGGKYDSTQQGYIFPSSTTAAQLPVISFAVGGKQFAVQKEDLGFADAGNGMVYGGIQSRGNNPFDILGDVFLKSIYAIFDQGNTRFGAVSRSEPTQNTSIPAGSS
ncbi:hypothetical protein OEA41_006612 [Lepraria neglecta]|uniref:Peptidase A1 domain-containing protein n=1 Tax=Lepraria neglecta TaxID=209136 RepID=A0AAD9Z9A1_9LECA|nr:hypothetical protein OEA41_006612 [Lepraria neglecta]